MRLIFKNNKYLAIVLGLFILFFSGRHIHQELTAVRMIENRFMPSIVKLKDGRVLVTGGNNQGVLDTAEIFDPKTNQFMHTKGKLNIPRYSHESILLEDGRVLIYGGDNPKKKIKDILDFEVFDPSTETFSLLEESTAKTNDTPAVNLNNGKAFIFGGYDKEGKIYYPALNKLIKTVGKSKVNHSNHTMTPLNDGNVLIAGGGYTPLGDLEGKSNSSYYLQNKSEIYYPKKDKFEFTGNLNLPRKHHRAVLLNDGRVFIVGGYAPKSGPYAECEIYDPKAGEFTLTEKMSRRRRAPAVIVLENGKVLISGAGLLNEDEKRISKSTIEIFDPITEKFTLLKKKHKFYRALHTLIQLDDGRIMLLDTHDYKRKPKYRRKVELIDSGVFKEVK